MVGKAIMHGGGHIDGELHTNSLEAVLNSVACGEELIEVDCVDLADGYGLAHDSTERSFYNISQQFHEIAFSEFRKLRVKGLFTPLTLGSLEQVSKLSPSTRFIIDAKFPVERFSNLIKLIDNYPDLRDRIIYQVYDEEWVAVLKRNGRSQALAALWRHFDYNPFSAEAMSFVEHACNELCVIGVSLRWQNPVSAEINLYNPLYPRLDEVVPVFLHGQNIKLGEEKTLTATGLNFFTAYSVKQVPQDFHPAAYVSLHNDLVGMSAIEATCHYIEHGQREGRRYRTDRPVVLRSGWHIDRP